MLFSFPILVITINIHGDGMAKLKGNAEYTGEQNSLRCIGRRYMWHFFAVLVKAQT
jgi:hypothetical protein